MTSRRLLREHTNFQNNTNVTGQIDHLSLENITLSTRFQNTTNETGPPEVSFNQPRPTNMTFTKFRPRLSISQPVGLRNVMKQTYLTPYNEIKTLSNFYTGQSNCMYELQVSCSATPCDFSYLGTYRLQPHLRQYIKYPYPSNTDGCESLDCQEAVMRKYRPDDILNVFGSHVYVNDFGKMLFTAENVVYLSSYSVESYQMRNSYYWNFEAWASAIIGGTATSLHCPPVNFAMQKRSITNAYYKIDPPASLSTWPYYEMAQNAFQDARYNELVVLQEGCNPLETRCTFEYDFWHDSTTQTFSEATTPISYSKEEGVALPASEVCTKKCIRQIAPTYLGAHQNSVDIDECDTCNENCGLLWNGVTVGQEFATQGASQSVGSTTTSSYACADSVSATTEFDCVSRCMSTPTCQAATFDGSDGTCRFRIVQPYDYASATTSSLIPDANSITYSFPERFNIYEEFSDNYDYDTIENPMLFLGCFSWTALHTRIESNIRFAHSSSWQHPYKHGSQGSGDWSMTATQLYPETIFVDSLDYVAHRCYSKSSGKYIRQHSYSYGLEDYDCHLYSDNEDYKANVAPYSRGWGFKAEESFSARGRSIYQEMKCAKYCGKRYFLYSFTNIGGQCYCSNGLPKIPASMETCHTAGYSAYTTEHYVSTFDNVHSSWTVHASCS